MVTGGRGVTVRLLLVLGLGATALAYLLLEVWTGQGGDLPPASWGSLIVLVFMACGVVFAGLPVRRFLRGQAKKPLNPIRAMRTVVLAQACGMTGALITGWYLAQVLALLPDLDIASRRALAWKLGALAAGGALMAITGSVVQTMCRVDRDPRDPHRDRHRDRHGGDRKEDGAHEGEDPPDRSHEAR